VNESRIVMQRSASGEHNARCHGARINHRLLLPRQPCANTVVAE
jgi:hypothetical protein